MAETLETPRARAARTGSRETRERRAERERALLDRLRETYPDAHCELAYGNPLELLVATILSARCTDKQVNQVTRVLFQKYRTAGDYARVPPAELEADIRRLGFFRNKTKSLRACGLALEEKHGGRVPDTMEALVQLAGVGRKTANVVLGNAFGRSEGIVVDTHVARLARRLGLSRETDPERIERDLMRRVPREDWTQFSHWLIGHGRRRCSARRPDCQGCEIRELCPTGAAGGPIDGGMATRASGRQAR